jgi:phosphoribosylformimino-5-aminoimidazole carboxamide ribotide isomerase
LFERFTVIPSIDLKDGKVVRLLRGDMTHATIYGSDPAATAAAFERDGAELIHIVDLDGAVAGEPRNLDSVRAIRAATRCKLDVSGGIRTAASMREVVAAGADIISIGSAALLNPDLLTDACRRLPGHIFGSLDLRDGRLAVKGWVETSELTAADAAARFVGAGAAALIVTDISRDGTQAGSNLALFSTIAQTAGIPVVASGGIATLDDLRALSAFFPSGVAGAITGRALYEGRFSLSEALSIVS